MRLPTYQQLSREQDEILNLPLDQSHLVAGPPGTGKTVLALYRADQAKRVGTRVDLLVFGSLLRQYVEQSVRTLGIEATTKTFIGWFFAFYRGGYGFSPPEIEPYVFDWVRILETINKSALAPGKRAGHLIVDEGQDIPENAFLVLQLVSDVMTVFADENQRLTERNSRLEEIRRSAGIRTDTHWLRRNYRNTAEIARLASHFETGMVTGVADPPERRGSVPVMLHHNSLLECVAYIARYEKNFSTKEIGVFTPTGYLQRRFVKQLMGKTRNPVQSFKSGQKVPVDFGRPGIKVVNFQSAKGLEFDTVFIPELQDVYAPPGIPDINMAFYVLMSRARDDLFLSYSGEGRPAILDLFPSDGRLEWR